MPTKWFNYLSIEAGPTEGVNKAWWLHHRSLARSTTNNPYLLANEWICSSLGWHLRLPIPPFAMMRKTPDSRRYFASLDFGTKESIPSDMVPSAVVKNFERVASGVVVFDVWIANPDRHEGNVKVDDPNDPKRIEVFDHDGALFGRLKGRGVERIQSCAARLGFTKAANTAWEFNKLAKAITSTVWFMDWIERVQAVPDTFIDELCQEATELGITKEEAEIGSQFLRMRKFDLAEIIVANKDFFESVTYSGLFLQ